MANKEDRLVGTSSSSSAGAVHFKIGDKFSSYEDLKSAISRYEKFKCIQLYQRDSKKLESAARTVPKKIEKANKKLKYYYINFCCSFGGKQYKNKSSGKRVHQRFVNVLLYNK